MNIADELYENGFINYNEYELRKIDELMTVSDYIPFITIFIVMPLLSIFLVLLVGGL